MDKLQAGLKERASKELIQQVVKKNGSKLQTSLPQLMLSIPKTVTLFLTSDLEHKHLLVWR